MKKRFIAILFAAMSVVFTTGASFGENHGFFSFSRDLSKAAATSVKFGEPGDDCYRLLVVKRSRLKWNFKVDLSIEAVSARATKLEGVVFYAADDENADGRISTNEWQALGKGISSMSAEGFMVASVDSIEVGDFDAYCVTRIYADGGHGNNSIGNAGLLVDHPE